jgi:toxin ParE1/3/4
VRIALDNQSAAERFLAAIESAYRQLAMTPEIGREHVTLNMRLDGVRVWLVRPFHMLVFYRIAPRHVEIIRVLHGARDVDLILDDE